MSPVMLVLSAIMLAGSIQAGVISGHYGGHLAANIETHDFSEGLTQSESSNYESLGSLGDHLPESHFPTDFEQEYKASEYEEGAAASEHIEYGGFEQNHFPQYEHEHGYISSVHNIQSDLHDFDTKPVPGINHGKGALSYSTTYEFTDPKP